MSFSDLHKNFLEPEIVYYKNTNALCIQGHPEWTHCEKRTSSMCLNLIDKYLKEFKEDKKSINPKYYKTSSFNPFESEYNEDEEYDYWIPEEEYEEEELPI